MDHEVRHMGRRSVLLGAAALGTGAALGCTGLAGLPAFADPDGAGRQSPIDIRSEQVRRAPNAPPLVVDYPDTVDVDLTYVNKDGEDGCGEASEDETIQAGNLSERAVVRRGDDVYRLVQTHFHITSEHLVDGRRFPMEQHLVHERVGDGALLVIGVFLRPGGHGPQDRVLRTLPEECADEPLRIRGLHLPRMLPQSLESWTYRGSLTTPPNTQGVTWHVMRQPRLIEASTINRFRRVFVEGDSRAPQPLNGRSVRLVRGRRA